MKSLDEITSNYNPITKKFIGFLAISRLNFKRNIGIMRMNVWRKNNPGWHLRMGRRGNDNEMITVLAEERLFHPINALKEYSLFVIELERLTWDYYNEIAEYHDNLFNNLLINFR